MYIDNYILLVEVVKDVKILKKEKVKKEIIEKEKVVKKSLRRRTCKEIVRRKE